MKGKKQNNKHFKTLILLTIIILVLITTIMLNKSKKEIFELTPEIARSKEYDEVQSGDEKTQSDYVKFDAFFLKDLNGDGVADSIRGTCNEIGKDDTLYMELRVIDDGHLENGKITINSNNFYFNTSIIKDAEISANYISVNTKEIQLNNIQNGSQKIITGFVRSGDYSNDLKKTDAINNNINNYSQKNSVTIQGTHVASDGTKTEINKTIEFFVDWYGIVETSIAETNIKNEYSDLTELINGDNINLSFVVKTMEQANELLLKSAHLEGTIPQLNGYDPISVQIEGTNIKYEYDSNTKKFKAINEAVTDESGNIITNAFSRYSEDNSYLRANMFTINVVYPIQAYNSLDDSTNIELLMPVTAYYTGYNNTNPQFQNPYESNIFAKTLASVWKVYSGDVYRFGVFVGKHLLKPYERYTISKEKPLKIYNAISEEEKEDYYDVRWYIYTGKDGAGTGAKIIGDGDKFITKGSEILTSENITSNIGIYLNNPVYMLGEDGWVKVYNNDTDELLITFTKNNWNTYSYETPYYYKTAVKNIRVETSATNPNSTLRITNIKEIDDKYLTDNYTYEKFETLEYIKSSLTGYFDKYDAAEESNIAYYEAPISYAGISIDTSAFSTQETAENVKIKITPESSYYNEQKWTNGIFLVRLPEEIIDAKINNINIDNSSYVNILGYDLYEKDGAFFIKIVTESDNASTYNITIDCNLTPNPRVSSITRNIELYAINEDATQYHFTDADKYDVDGDLNITEKVNYTTTAVNLVSPNSLITNQIVTKYDSQNSVTIAPRVAKIDKNQRNATIEVEITNNYSSLIGDILIQGVIPFRGNTYVLSGKDLNSEFDTYMSSDGIQIPEILKEHVKIYYSTQERPTKDIKNLSNGWTLAQDVQDWNAIKSYIIDLGDYELQKGESHIFTYKINIPEGINYNQISYSEHGVYFSLVTDAGKYATSTASTKLGFMIAKQYDVQIDKYQKNTEKLLSGITFSIQEEGVDNKNIRITDKNGQAIVTGLFAEKTYIITEIKTTEDYEILSTPIRIYAYTNEDGELCVDYKDDSGNTIDVPSIIKSSNIEKETGKDYTLHIKLENEVKAKLKLIKQDENNNALKNVKFRLSGKGKDSVILTTNSAGQILASGLYLGEEYTLQETRADGYYLIGEKIKFRITSTTSGFNLEILSGNDYIKTSNYITTDEIPTINLTLGNEKIPTYSLQLTKYEKDTENKLSGAQFVIYGQELPEKGVIYTTDKNGEIKINNLYEYVESKGDISGEYTIKEIFAPEGFSLDPTEIKFKAQRVDGTLQLQVLQGEDKLKLIDGQSYSVEGTNANSPIIKIALENAPTFKLTKVGEDGEPLQGAKFEISSTSKDAQAFGIGGNENDYIRSASSTSDGGYIVGGYFNSSSLKVGEKIIERIGGYDGILIKYNSSSEVEWTKVIGGSKNERIYSVYQTSDDGYIVGGWLRSSSIDLGNGVTIQNSDTSTWAGMIIKYDKNGNAEWAKSIDGGDSDNYVYDVKQTKDGEYIVGGYFYSTSIDFENGIIINNKGTTDYKEGMIIKLNSTGEIQWAKSIGGENDEEIYKVIETTDGNIIGVGHFYSSTIDLENNTKLTNSGTTSYDDAIIVSYDKNGNLNWGKSFGDNSYDTINDLCATYDGGVIVAGDFCNSINLGKNIELNSTGSNDGIIIKYSSSGDVVWAKSLGGERADMLETIKETNDGGYILGGRFRSRGIDFGNNVVIQHSGDTTYYDGMIVKYNSDLEAEWAKSIGGDLEDYIRYVTQLNNNNYIIGGYYESNTIKIDNTEISNSTSNTSDKSWTDGILVVCNEIYTRTTDKNGNILLGLPEGLYKATEIEAPKGYQLPENEEDRTKYFGVGASRPRKVEFKVVWNNQIKGTEWNEINSTYATTDGGLVAVGSIYGTATSLNLTSNGLQDGLIVKYNANGVIEWTKNIGGSQDDIFTKVVQTKDGGYAIVGTTESYDIDVDISLKTKGYKSGILIKLDSSGNYMWGRIIGGNYDDYLYSIIEDSDSNLIVTGESESENLYFTDSVKATRQGISTGFVVEFSSNGTYKWNQIINSTKHAQIVDVTETNYGYVIAANFGGVISVNGSDIASIDGTSTDDAALYQDGIIIGYNKSGNYQWHTLLAGTNNDKLKGLITTSEGDLLVYGGFGGTITYDGKSITAKGTNNLMDIMLLKFSSLDGKYKENSIKTLGGNYEDVISQVVETENGEYLLGGYYYSPEIDINGDGTNDITTINKGNEITGEDSTYIYSDGFIMKLNSENELEIIDNIKGTGTEEVRTIAQLKNSTTGKAYIAAGAFDSIDTDILGQENALKSAGYNDGFVIKYDDILLEEEVQLQQELTFNNELKKFKVTAQILTTDDSGNIIGGTFTGGDYGIFDGISYPESEHVEYVENIKYGKTGQKEIIITPDVGYKISSIKINNKQYIYTPDENGVVTIPVFENMLEDKKVDIEFSNTTSSVTIKHLLWDNKETTTPLSNDEYISGEIGKSYTTAPKTDLNEYVIITNSDFYGTDETGVLNKTGYTTIEELLNAYNYNTFEEFLSSYYIPTNATGTYTAEEQVVKYYYKERTYSLTINYYVEGTTTPVPSNAGGVVESIIEDTQYHKGQQYETNSSTNVDSKYELVEMPANATGTIERDTVVTYYYRVKDSAGVIVHHYIEEADGTKTTTQVSSKTTKTEIKEDGTVVTTAMPVADEELPKEGTAKVGDSYTTKASTEIAPNYVLVETPSNATGEYAEELTEVIYYYKAVVPGLTNTISKTGTENISKESEQVAYNIQYNATISDYIGRATIKIVDTLPYEIDTTKPYDLNGGTYNETNKTITWNYIYDIDTYSSGEPREISITRQISVTYKNVDFSTNQMSNQVIGTTTLEDGRNVSSTDTTNTNYQFKTDVVVTKRWEDNENILGIRPSSINVTISATNAEIEDTITKTIELNSTNSWTYTWKDLPKYNSHGEQINYQVKEEALTGNLGIVYNSEAKQDETNIYNWTITNTYVESTEKMNIVVNKVWDDDNNKAGKRPESIKLQVFKNNEESPLLEYVLTNTETSHTFEVPKYNGKGEEIVYKVGEAEVVEGDLKFYVATIGELTKVEGSQDETGNTNLNADYTATITNKFTIPSDKIKLKVNKVWDDDSDKAGKRPNSVNIVIKKIDNTTTEKQEVLTYELILENETSHEFELPKYDDSGQEINYIVEEKEVNKDELKFYTSQIKQSETNVNEYTITNTFNLTQEYISITISKEWVDNETQALKRPNSILIKLMNGDAVVGDSKVMNSTNNWEDIIFENIPKYDSKGSEIKYTIKEEEVNAGNLKFYKGTIGEITKGTEENQYTIKITNTFTKPEDKVIIKGIKIWDDNNNTKRPSSITLVLSGDGKTTEKILTNRNVDSVNSNYWTTEFEMPKYNDNGEEIKYVLSEKEVGTEVLSNYITTIKDYIVTNKMIIKDSNITKTGPNTITGIDETLEYTINYNVTLDEGYKGTATITLVDTLPYEIDETKEYNLNGGTYDSTNKMIIWTGTYDASKKSITWDNGDTEDLTEGIAISKKITLVYKELPIGAEETIIRNNVEGKVQLETGATETTTSTFDTNTNFKINISVEKVWKGDTEAERPTEVTIQLLANEEVKETIVLNSPWTHIFENLDKYNETTREEIKYSVTETNVPEGYYLSNVEKTTIEDGEKYTLTNYKCENLTITKVAEEDHKITLSGSEFKLYKLKEGISSDNNLIDKNNVSSDWTLVNTYVTKEDGLINLEKLESTSEYRLVETKAPEGRVIPTGQWKIEFVNGDYDENDESIQNIDGTLVKISSIGNPPALAIENGKLLLPNKQYYKFPSSGNIGTDLFYLIGSTTAVMGLIILFLRKKSHTIKRTAKHAKRK